MPGSRRAASCARTGPRPGVPGDTATARTPRVARTCAQSRLADGMAERYPRVSTVTAPPRGIMGPSSGSVSGFRVVYCARVEQGAEYPTATGARRGPHAGEADAAVIVGVA